MSQGAWPPNVMDTILRQISQFGPVGSTKVYQVPALGTSVPLAVSATVPSTLQAPPLQFREAGVVLAMYGQERSGTGAKFATTGVRVQIGGQEDLFTDGNSGVPVSMLSLFGGAINRFPLWRRVIPGVNWVVTYYNYDAVAVAYPDVSFAFLADADLARHLPSRQS